MPNLLTGNKKEDGQVKLEEAKHLRHGQTVYLVGHWDSNGQPSKCRVTGKVQTWKTRPNEVRVPVKRGLYDHGAITHRNLDRFTLKEPATKKRKR